MHTKIKGYHVRLKKHIKNVFRCIPDIQFKLLFHSHMHPILTVFATVIILSRFLKPLAFGLIS